MKIDHSGFPASVNSLIKSETIAPEIQHDELSPLEVISSFADAEKLCPTGK